MSTIIKGWDRDVTVCVETDISRAQVEAYLKYCQFKGYPSPDVEPEKGISCLYRVIANHLGEDVNVYVMDMSTNAGWLLSEDQVQRFGTRICKVFNWEIYSYQTCDAAEAEDLDARKLREMLIAIDAAMPIKQQLGAEYLSFERVKTNTLKPGDKVFISVLGKIVKRTVLDIAKPHEWCEGRDVSSMPYIDLYQGIQTKDDPLRFSWGYISNEYVWKTN